MKRLRPLCLIPVLLISGCGGSGTDPKPTEMVNITFTNIVNSNAFSSPIELPVTVDAARYDATPGSVQTLFISLTDPPFPDQTRRFQVAIRSLSIEEGFTFPVKQTSSEAAVIEFNQFPEDDDLIGDWIGNAGTVTVTKLDTDYIWVRLENVDFVVYEIGDPGNKATGTFRLNGEIQLIRTDREP